MPVRPRGIYLMPEVTVSSKGQIVLPRNIRNALGINEGERLRVTVEDERIIIVPTHSSAKNEWRNWRGMLRGTRALQEHMAEHAEEAKK